MATKIISMTYQLKRGSESAIEAKNPILASGEPIVVFCPNNITKIKVGDGRTPYKELPFVSGAISYTPEGDIVNIMIDTELSLESKNPVENRVITAALDTKVDKEAGKGLSTNDFTDAHLSKLTELEHLRVDTSLDIKSFNPISNNAVTTAFKSIVLDGGEITEHACDN